MRIRFIVYPIVVLCLTIIATQLDAMACTTFQFNHEGQVIVGKNYDWMVEDGLI